MATIEERAHQYGCKAAGGWYKGGMRGSVYKAHHDAYIEIATEQQKITIDKACEWLSTLPEQLDVYEDSHYIIDRDTLIEQFKQAMEE